MTRRRPERTYGHAGHGITERQLAPRTGLRLARASGFLTQEQSCIGSIACTNVDVTTLTAGPAYPLTITNADQRAAFNPHGVLPYPCTVAVVCTHTSGTGETTGATGAGYANNGSKESVSAGTGKKFQVKLFGLDIWGNAIEELLPQQIINEPSCAASRWTVWSTKVFSRITKWEYTYANMDTGDNIAVGVSNYWNRNSPFFLFIDATGGSYTFHYKGQNVTVNVPADHASAAAWATKIETASNIAAGEVKVTEPFGAGSGVRAQPFMVWIDNSNSGTGTPLLDPFDRTNNIYVDSTGLTGGNQAVWIGVPRWERQDSAGIALPLLSEPHSPDHPQPWAEFVSGHIAKVDTNGFLAQSLQQAKKNAAGTFTSPGVVVGREAAGVMGDVQKWQLYHRRYDKKLEFLGRSGALSIWDELNDIYEASPYVEYWFDLLFRTTAGSGRHGAAKSSYVWG